jgi:hypothetical protein
MNKSKKENLVKIIFAVVAFVLIVVIIIMLFFRKGFANLTNKQLICENTSLGYKTKSTIIYKSNNMYEEKFDGEEPLTSEYKYKKATKEDLKSKEYKEMSEVKNGDSYLLTLKERKQKQKNGKIITLDKDVDYIVTVKDKYVQIFSKSRNINKLCKIK